MSRVLALVVLAALLAACGDLEFITPSPQPPQPPHLATMISVNDSIETRVEVVAVLALGRREDGAPFRVLHPTLHIGEITLLPEQPHESTLRYRMTAAGAAVELLLASLRDGPAYAPQVEGFTAPTPTMLGPITRWGAAEVVWREPSDLVLRLAMPPAVREQASDRAHWSLDLFRPQGAEMHRVLSFIATGLVPTEIRVPAALVEACAAERLVARLRFTVQSSDTTEANEYPLTASTSGTLWWDVIRECA